MVAMEIEKSNLNEIYNGTTAIPAPIKRDLRTIAKILNINWVERGIENEARLICSRGAVCPRKPRCYGECGE
ncbi:hypothetical protein AM625_07235 [Vibrio cholerae O1 biovar El Tor]|nr:hypothetical protein AM625_07235 [Vibrio cholerae O1 biovar El Tor]